MPRLRLPGCCLCVCPGCTAASYVDLPRTLLCPPAAIHSLVTPDLRGATELPAPAPGTTCDHQEAPGPYSTS
ncbi:hypothetical protein GDO81_015070 [Engystomops pustulosus]|uniref:Secreted protein n=1 Tax=Engystomops pustulosus TaxID=76066 RepID=A0AAV7ANC8_ENGPU|nr:hypothetical protein GDO81_015070 [Engystomops pustulosus]